jgi:hypothetical protein
MLFQSKSLQHFAIPSVKLDGRNRQRSSCQLSNSRPTSALVSQAVSFNDRILGRGLGLRGPTCRVGVSAWLWVNPPELNGGRFCAPRKEGFLTHDLAAVGPGFDLLSSGGIYGVTEPL